MREEWKVEPIGKIATIINGGTPKSGVAEYWDGDVLWITPKDMGKLNGDYVAETSRKITEQGLAKSSAKLISANSVILSTRAPIGHLAINKQPMATNQGCRGIVPSSALDTKFLFYFFRLNVPLLNELGSGTTFKELAKNALAGIEIPLPPLPEQKRIVAILDEAFEGIGRAVANAEKNLANARELFESYLNAVFTQKGEGWVEEPVEGLATVVSGFSFKSSDFSPKNSAKSIKITNVGVRKFITNSSSNLPINFVKKYSSFLICEGSIVLALTRSVISNGLKVAVVPKEFDGSLLNQRVAALKIDSDDILRRYLFYFLCTSSVADYVKKKVNTLMQPNLSINDLKKLAVPMAPSNQRAEIVRKLLSLAVETQRLQTLYQQKLTALTELKQSLLQKAFTGELTANPETALKQEAVA